MLNKDSHLGTTPSQLFASVDHKQFLSIHLNEVRAFLQEGMVAISSFIHRHGLPRGVISRVQNHIYNLETSLEIEEACLDNLQNKRNQLVEELEAKNCAIAKTQASIDRSSASLEARNRTMDDHEQHESRMQAIQMIQDFLNSL